MYRTCGSLVDGKHDKCRNSSVSRLKGSPAKAEYGLAETCWLGPSSGRSSQSCSQSSSRASLAVTVSFPSQLWDLAWTARCDAMQCNAMHLRLALTNSGDKPMAPERLNPSLASQHTSVASPRETSFGCHGACRPSAVRPIECFRRCPAA